MPGISLNILHENTSLLLEHFCNSLIQDPDRSIVIKNECFIEIYGKMDDFDSEENAKAFLYMLAKEKCDRFLKRAATIIN